MGGPKESEGRGPHPQGQRGGPLHQKKALLLRPSTDELARGQCREQALQWGVQGARRQVLPSPRGGGPPVGLTGGPPLGAPSAMS
ncbi:hypothetical protein ACSSS7_008338 [Eimeria intestinalis]